jgi:hypothetical protein
MSAKDREKEDDIGDLVPDSEVLREFGISTMTLWRWDQDLALGFPPPIRIRKRKFRSRNRLNEFKVLLLRNAIERRAQRRTAS